jgi:hypothetical protein
MNTWNTIVIIAGTLLLFFLYRKEMMRRNKARLALRIIVSVITVVCLVCMGLPVTISRSTVATAGEAIVITAGADKDSIQQFKKLRNSTIPVLEEDELLSDYGTQYDSLHVFGYGFSDEELQTINAKQFIFHPSPIKTGITNISWNGEIKKGETLLVQGTYTNNSALPVALSLNGFNSTFDSMIIPAKKIQSFQLHTVPKQNGKAVYSVSVRQGKELLEKNNLPIEVINSSPIQVMILSSSPDFENKFLKDWLSQNGYTVVTKTMISTNKFDRSIVNAKNMSLDRITPSLMDSFDVLIADELSLLSLSKAEQENIYRQVDQKGMGLLVRADSITTTPAWYAASFRLYGLSGKQPLQLSIPLSTGHAILPVEQPKFIRSQPGTQPLLLDSVNNMVAAATVQGAGKIVFTTLNNTYSWILAGNTASYYSVWNTLLQKAARHDIRSVTMENLPGLPVTGQPVTMQLRMVTDSLPVMQLQKSQLAFAQNKELSSKWASTYWPPGTGWQPAVSMKDVTYNWYVFDKNDWKYVSASGRIAATALYSRQQKNSGKNGQEMGQPAEIPVSLIYFFIPFIICAGFLWMERKIS